MPERKVKAKARPPAVLARVFLALTAPLFLTACLPEMIRNSALLSPKPQPAPAATVLAEAPALPPPTPLAPYGPMEPADADAPETLETAAAGPSTEAAPTVLHSYQPALPPQTFTFASGLIDLDIFEPFPGRLATAQAGGLLLLAHGLGATMDDEPEDHETPLEPLMVLAGPALSENDPAPSAGEPALPGFSLNLAEEVKGKRAKQPGGARTMSLLTAAYEQTGRHYKRGGGTPLAGFDAAGYTHWVFAREGLTLPKTPAGLASAGTTVTRENLRPGDVLIYRNQADQLDGWHVGIYSGQGNFLHASPKAGVVTETDAFGPQYAPYFLGGRRFFDDPGAAPLSDNQKMAATSTAVKLALTELGPNDKAPRPAPPKPKKSKASSKSKAAKKAAKK